MFISQQELASFHKGVEMVSALLPCGNEEQAAGGIGGLAAAISRVDSPERAYAFADSNCYDLDLSPDEAFSPWQTLAFLGVRGALEQARMRAGVSEQISGIRLKTGQNITDVQTGNHLLGLVAAGDQAVIPLARQHILETRDDPHLINYRPRRALKLYQAGDAEALDLTLHTAQEAKERSFQSSEDQSGCNQIDIALWGLATRMLKRCQVEKMDSLLALMDNPAYKARVLAESYAAGASPDGEAAEKAILLCDQIYSTQPHEAWEVLDMLVKGGFPRIVEAYRDFFITKNTRVNDIVTSPQRLAVLYKAGETAAKDRMLELAQREDFMKFLPFLGDVGLKRYAYDGAAALHRVAPSRRLLKEMLAVHFTTEQWEHLWDLPLDIPSFNPGDTIYFRANDVKELAEHLSDTKIHFEPQD